MNSALFLSAIVLTREAHLNCSLCPHAQYDPVDAAYPASDEALRIVSRKPQCSWLSVTNGDNAYGSAVVRTVLETQRPLPNLVMLPMSSRNFDNEGKI